MSPTFAILAVAFAIMAALAADSARFAASRPGLRSNRVRLIRQAFFEFSIYWVGWALCVALAIWTGVRA